MIVYSETKRNFINKCKSNSGKDIEEALVKAMTKVGIKTFGSSQRSAWKNSLPAMAEVLDKAMLADDAIVAVEYQIKQAKDRLDFVITGEDPSGNNSVVIVELKQWSNVSNSSLDNFVYANVGGTIWKDHWHPSYQAKNYANIMANTYEVI